MTAKQATHSTYCRKEKEIAIIHEKVERIEKEVVGNGDGLIKTVPHLASTVNDLKMVTANLDRNLDRVVKVLDRAQGEKDGKAEIRRRTRWLVGTLVGVILTMIGGIITLIHLFVEAKAGG